jgi:hypothetical protein
MLAAKFSKGCVLLALVCNTTVALGQYQGGETPPRFYQWQSLPLDLAFGYQHASTALEGALGGRAEVIRAKGDCWLAVSQAKISSEQARKLALENRKRFVGDKIAERECREADQKRRIAERRVVNEVRRSVRYEVYRLSADQIDRTSGTILWSKMLLAAEYDEVRERLDELFRSRSVSRNTVEVMRCVQSMTADLRRNRANASPVEYLAAQKFLCGVKHEAEFPLVSAESPPVRELNGNGDLATR